MYLRSGIGMTPAVCQMKNGSFCRPKQSAANSVADQVDVGEGGADEGAGQGVVLQTKKGHYIEILGGFHRCGENHDIDRQESDALGEEDPAKTADQRRYKYVADVGPNEIVMHIQRNIQFNEEDDHKKGRVSNASFFHKISPP